MKIQTSGGVSVLIGAALLGSGVATMAMLRRIRKTRLFQRTRAVNPVPANAVKHGRRRPQWDEPVSRTRST